MDTTILLIEPYYSGSHKVLIDILHEEIKSFENVRVELMTMTGKKWHWRARTSALYFAQHIPKIDNLKCIFTSCVLPLQELLGLRSDLNACKKIVYFHENQLVYPVRKSKDRDFQYGYNQIMTCLAADLVLFNSKFNQTSFLENIKTFFKLQPDYRPNNLREQIEPKTRVMYFPLKFDTLIIGTPAPECLNDSILRIVWPHRWEYDKNPDMFFNAIYALKRMGTTNFRLNILGESFTDNPTIFSEAQLKLADVIEHFGYASDKAQYYDILQKSDIVISTASHEFFGVAMLEGVACGCFPLAPNNLVYPEIFPYKKCLYNTPEDLVTRLSEFINQPDLLKDAKSEFHQNFSLYKYKWKFLKDEYMNLIIK